MHLNLGIVYWASEAEVKGRTETKQNGAIQKRISDFKTKNNLVFAQLLIKAAVNNFVPV